MITEYFNIIREFTTQNSDKLLDLMEHYRVNSLSEITEQMARDYIDEHPEMRKRRIQYEQMVNGGNTSL